MNGRHQETAPEKWYGNAKYAEYLRSRSSYTSPSALSLYPGHASYSGMQPDILGPANEDTAAQNKLPEEKTDGNLTADLTGSPSEGSDAVDNLLASRLEGLQQNIQRIRYQLDRREELKRQNIYEIDREMMKRKTELFECEKWMPGTNKIIERRRGDLEKQLQQMQKEKRLEEVASWRDHQRLLKDLREIMDDYRDVFRRRDLVSGSYSPSEGTSRRGQ